MRLKRQALWPIAELMAIVLAQLVLTPLLLHRLGPDPFAAWILAQTALLAATTLSLGTGLALLPVVAGALSRGDAPGVWSAVRLFMRRTWTTSGVFGVGLVLAVPLQRVAGSNVDGSLPLVAATLGWVVATEFDNGFSSALKALGRFDHVATVEVISRGTQILLTVLLVASGDTAFGTVTIAAVCTALKAVCKYSMFRRELPSRTATPQLSNTRKTAASALSSAGFWAWMGLGGGLAFHAFDRWFVGIWFGPSVLAAYAVCGQLAQLPHALVSAAAQVLVPWAARQRGGMRYAATRQRVRRLLLYVSFAAAVPSLALLVLLDPLLRFWISPQFAVEHLKLAQGMVLVFLVLSLNVPSYFLEFGFGLLRAQTLIVLFAGVTFATGCLILSPGLESFVALKGLFAVLSLGLVAHVVWWSAAPR